MREEQRDRLRAFVAGHRDTAPARWVAATATRYLHQFHNLNERIDSNGERRVIERLAALAGPDEPMVVFDVGANIGEWSIRLAPLLRRGTTTLGTIHAFEPVPGSVELLRANLAGQPNVVIEEIGLGARTGTERFRLGPGDHSVLASAVRDDYEHFGYSAGDEVLLPVVRGDDYLAEHGIDRVTLAKIDVEGLELDVLRGFGDRLSDGSIGAVQFEYGHVNMAAGHLLGAFASLLGEAGFELGKIYPHGVDFRPYDIEQERWAGLNHLAVRLDRPDLRSAFA